MFEPRTYILYHSLMGRQKFLLDGGSYHTCIVFSFSSSLLVVERYYGVRTDKYIHVQYIWLFFEAADKRETLPENKTSQGQPPTAEQCRVLRLIQRFQYSTFIQAKLEIRQSIRP